MNKLLVISLIILLSLPVISYSEEQPTKKILKLVADRWEPYQFTSDRGVCVDRIRQVFHNTNYEIQIDIVPWARALMLLEKKEADGLFSALYDKQRENFTIYPTESLITSEWYFYGLDKNIYTGNKEQLVNLSVGGVRSYTYPSIINQFKEIEYVTNDETNIRKLLVGRIDLIMMEKRNGDYLKQQIDTTNQIVCLDKYPLKKKIFILSLEKI